MNEYLNRINNESQAIFKESLKEEEQFTNAHRMSACIFEFAQLLTETNEKKMLITTSEHLEAASMNLALGFYRQAFASLKLALEVGLGAVYFSVYKMEDYEWQNGIADVQWQKVIDKETGILSKRFATAFYPEMENAVKKYHESTTALYSQLSAYVHGNTGKWDWEFNGIFLRYNATLAKTYFELSASVTETILFVLFSRYIRSFSEDRSDLIPAEIYQIPTIHSVLTGEE
ncbi:hypothetical protein CLV59_108176 [Chitinophaga dinghuensis]|uniref:Uncharacterized protein n=1 Tax=Chitinophaga dinghuensis TaxID=1539050 RepID=A0A327VQC4_9BACT|nr:hypothetical protein [Chitinophaga dinghuensis]RAJ76656.1 hypothetical protein CLV59_108176 [Chitinophaga dinghuensis]